MAGRTDAWILNDAALAHGIPPDSPHLARFREAYLRYLAVELEKPGVARKGLMPGVRELLDALAPRDEVYVALLTGNYEAGARLKLDREKLPRRRRISSNARWRLPAPTFVPTSATSGAPRPKTSGTSRYSSRLPVP